MNLPRTTSEIKAEYRRRALSPFDFGSADLLYALAYEDAKEFLQDTCTPGQWSKEDLIMTRESVLRAMSDYAEFAWGKVSGHRGLSAGRNLDHYISWCWLLGDEESVAFMRDDKNYPNYGAPALAYVCKKYGLFVPEDPGIQRMILGRRCTDDCAMGCV